MNKCNELPFRSFVPCAFGTSPEETIKRYRLLTSDMIKYGVLLLQLRISLNKNRLNQMQGWEVIRLCLE
jgi:hypothetical protein